MLGNTAQTPRSSFNGYSFFVRQVLFFILYLFFLLIIRIRRTLTPYFKTFYYLLRFARFSNQVLYESVVKVERTGCYRQITMYMHKLHSDCTIPFFVIAIVKVIQDWNEESCYLRAKLTVSSGVQPSACELERKKKDHKSHDGSL